MSLRVKKKKEGRKEQDETNRVRIKKERWDELYA